MISLILGLGNIGERYLRSRHNLGFEVVAASAVLLKAGFDSTGDTYEAALQKSEQRRIVLARPTTYVNRSGQAANALLQEYDLDPSQMLVVVDDFNLPTGILRLRRGGSDGGHNGLASIIEALDTIEFPRLRMGIGPLPEDVDAADFVLGQFEQSELADVERMIKVATEAAIFTISHHLDEAMSKYNVNPA
jgi:PTH1 family peptidyl-tRNA hydrolase